MCETCNAKFKIGDRIEVVMPAGGVEPPDLNNVGEGTVVDVDLEGVQVKVDSNEKPWWYGLKAVRPLGRTIFDQKVSAGTIEPEPVKASTMAPKPSPKVGDHVRLTGVVETVANDVVEVAFPDGNKCFIAIEHDYMEIIRQPFKRGEVVWSCGAIAAGEQYVVFNDESGGYLDVVHCKSGTATTRNLASDFERRP